MWYFNSTITYLILDYLYGGGELANDFTVDTTYGTVRGLKSAVSRNAQSYFEFLGIPYARPPIGDLRFAPPVPPYTWDGILNATSPGNRCLQIRITTNSKLGDEDCLNLNVYTKRIQTSRTHKPLDNLHPVIFYIHGGFFMAGSADVFGAKYFMDEDVVLVTANYRVASLGFLNMGTEDVRGNMGLKDQVMVLRWIQENIMFFGGDPNCVTIMGESAGAVSASYHMLSPLSGGLFHRVIAQSGNSLAPWALNLNPKIQAARFAESLNCTRNSSKETVACLRSLDSNTLIEAHRDALYHLEDHHTLFRPSVEIGSDEWTFLNDTPINILRNHGSSSVPQMSGVNSREGLLFALSITRNETKRNELNANWKTKVPVAFDFNNNSRKDEISQKIWDFYFGEGTPEITEDSWPNATDMMSDFLFFNALHEAATLYQNGAVQNASLYLYYFDYQPEFSLGKIAFGMSGSLPVMADIAVSVGVRWFKSVLGRSDTSYGSAHMDEVFLQFAMPFQKEHSEGTKDYEASKNLIKMWISFARDGKPDGIHTEWHPIQQGQTNKTLQYMKLDRQMEFIDEPFQERMQFWHSLNLKPHV